MWTVRLLQHRFSLPPDLVDVHVTAKSERDLGIREERSEHLLDALLAAQGKSIHDGAPHYDQVRMPSYVSFQTSTG